ncbi:MAG TPA: DinB family protein [Bryobacteraceae bacterium]|nr:DinB family protein [Bryobacteraceae bacterium]
MKRRAVLGSVVMGTMAVAVPEVEAAGTELEIFLARWEKAKVFTLQVADAMPADSYDFKPKSEMRGFGQLIQHLATNNAFYISRFKAGEIPDSLLPSEKFDKETTKRYVTESFDFCAGVLKGIKAADLDKSYPGRPNTAPQTGWDWVLHAFIHTAHHRGYAEVYLREKGITPPRYSV